MSSQSDLKCYDVIVVGAGPAGALCALLLAQKGIKVLILESQLSVKRKICGEYLCPQGVQLLHDLKLSSTLQGHLALHGMKITNYLGHFVIGYFTKDHHHYQGASLNRQIFETNLIELCRKAGVVIKNGQTVKALSWKSVWQVETREGSSFQADFLIGADGKRSIVGQLLKLNKKINNKRVAIHTLIKTAKGEERLGEMHLFSDGSYIGIDPIHAAEMNITLVCDSKKIKEAKKPELLLNHYIQKSMQLSQTILIDPKESEIHTVSPITHQVKSVASQHFALIGDAAGFLDPLTGEGIYHALWDAREVAKLFNQHSKMFSHRLYRWNRYREFALKNILGHFFQMIIRCPKLTEIILRFLKRKKDRSDVFISMIGNIYSPGPGLIKLIRG